MFTTSSISSSIVSQVGSSVSPPVSTSPMSNREKKFYWADKAYGQLSWYKKLFRKRPSF